MKNIAESAIRLLLPEIMDGNFKRADAIERRFRIVGYADALNGFYDGEHQSFLDSQSRRHDFLIPDRITYLHR